MMLPPSVRIYLAVDPVDMRCGHDGLAAIVRTQWKLDLYSGHLFVFAGKRGDRLKILFFDRGGFVVYYKRLERGRFRLPRLRPGSTSVELDAAELSMPLSGIDVDRVERPQLWSPGRLRACPASNTVDRAPAL
jgi:transposase